MTDPAPECSGRGPLLLEPMETMTMLTEVNRLSDAVLPLEACKAHLRLGHGFADDGGQDALIGRYLRSAMQAIEARTGKALIQRDFRLRLPDWRDPRGVVLPVAPVVAVHAVTLLDGAGEGAPLAAARYRLEADPHRPRLCPTGWALPHPPAGGAVEVVFRAGLGPAWRDVPDDLAQAVMMLTAQYHENRQGDAAAPAGMAFGIMALIAPWRVLRTSAGGGR